MLTTTIKSWQKKIQNINLKQREVIFEPEVLKLNKIISFVWPRRAWKTYYMYQIIKNLISQNIIKLEQVVFIDFVELEQTNINFDEILEAFFSIYPDLEPFFVFDEIQEIDNFKEWILKLYNDWYKIFVSWSNSKMLSSELATQFRWRNIEYFILPLSFKEFLTFKEFKDHSTLLPATKWKLKNLFLEYLKYGWYPEIAMIDNIELKENLLKNYFDIIIYKDLIDRYSISNEYTLKYLLKRIITNNGKELSINKIYNDLKSQNIAVSKDTLYNYFEYIKNIFFSKTLSNYFSPKWQGKLYLLDTWIANITNRKFDKWQSFENMVYLELLRKHKENLYYKKNWAEIDFYIPNSDTNIQVCFDLNIENKLRELSAFDKVKWIQNILINFNIQDDLELDNNVINTNFLDFFLW